MAKATSLKDRQQLDELVNKLTSLTKKPPTTLPCGLKDSPIAAHFCDLSLDSIEGPYYMFNKSWEHVFQHPDNEKELLIVQGKYGLDIALAYIVHFSKAPGIEENGGLGLLAMRIMELEAYFSGTYPCLNGNALKWWKVC
jgi:hypothetical protein